VHVCVYANTPTHCTSRCEPRGRDETLVGPEDSESKWPKLQQICIRMCTKYTCVYIYAVRRDEILSDSSFAKSYFVFRKGKAKGVIVQHCMTPISQI